MKTNTLTLFLIVLLSGAVSAQLYTKVSKTVANDRGSLDHFGHAISISGPNLLIGAFIEDDDVNGNFPMEEAGSAYFFKLDMNGNWIQHQKVVANDRSIDDRFGTSVSVNGNWAAVGAYLEDHDANGNLYQKDAGSVYIFNLNSNGDWIQTQKIVASDRQSGDFFGTSVSIFGNYLAVGAYLEDDDVNQANAMAQAGSVYIYKKDAQNTWNEIGKVLPNDRGVGDEFGISVSLDNDRLLVGCTHGRP